MSCTREQIVKQMRSWIGRKESDGSHKKIIDIYNTINPLPVGYKLKYTDAWCAGAVSAAAKVCSALDIIPAECSCPRMIELLKKKGIWQEADNRVPQPGDLIFYDWDDSGKGDNTGNPDHVGIVEQVVGDTIHVIEGNYDNAVKRRYIRVNGRYIRGFGVPKYEAEAVFTLTLRQLRRGDRGEDVRALQRLLPGYLSTKDGDFGPLTEAALLEFQRERDLIADGIAGPVSYGELLGVKEGDA